MLIEYIKSREPIIQGEEGRISFYTQPTSSSSGNLSIISNLILPLLASLYAKFL